MARTYRASERSQLKKNLSRKRFNKVVPKWGRNVDKAKYLRTLEVQAYKRGRTIDLKYRVKCYGKVRYGSEEEARSKRGNAFLIPYKCDYCIFWHIGRRPANDPLANSYSWNRPNTRPKEELNEQQQH